MSRIHVFARVRQNLKGENGDKIKFQNENSQHQGKSPSPTADSFDAVFESSRKLEDVYAACLLGLIKPFFEGCNAALVVFGETDSGQIKTILGGEVGNILKSSKKSSGLLSLLVDDLFKKSAEIQTEMSYEFKLMLTIVEIKGTKITDLMIMSGRNEDRSEGNGKSTLFLIF